MFNEKLPKFLFLFGMAGWIVALLLVLKLSSVNDFERLEAHVKTKAAENAFNIVSQALQDKKTDEDIVKQMEVWFKDGWTAQTGSVTTICDNDRSLFLNIMNEETISTVCRLRI
ncbi:hypothetical protein GNP80_00195 [Aliivibrio fischeri]|uniref:hypothetical protein n=1 Tax=Aliivibrio fischeri TaxID=668 RepID=UPI0012D91F4C|nr:hypothetical protein [Aliivibrio fischeri]MUK90874.1 hypothetical protein [Aliivibrio fischeri]